MSYLKNNKCPYVRGSTQYWAWMLAQYMPHIFKISNSDGFLYTSKEDANNFNVLMASIGLSLRIHISEYDVDMIYICHLSARDKKRFREHLKQLKKEAN